MHIGPPLLAALGLVARERDFHMIVRFALERNPQGKALDRKQRYREVGIFWEHGKREGRYADVVAMEKLL